MADQSSRSRNGIAHDVEEKDDGNFRVVSYPDMALETIVSRQAEPGQTVDAAKRRNEATLLGALYGRLPQLVEDALKVNSAADLAQLRYKMQSVLECIQDELHARMYGTTRSTNEQAQE